LTLRRAPALSGGAPRSRACASAILAAAILSAICLWPSVAGAEYYVYAGKWGSRGAGAGQFLNPCGIAVDAEGHVYVSDTFNHRIQRFTSAGGYLGGWGTSGTGPDQVRSPRNIEIHGSSVYVADTSNNRISVFGLYGAPIAQWGGGASPIVFLRPRGVAVSPSGSYCYAADTLRSKIQMLDATTGDFVIDWGTGGSSPGPYFDGPEGVATGPTGTVFVADTQNNRVQTFTSTGDYIASWGGYGTEDSRLWGPCSIDVDGSNYVYVADANNGAAKKFTSTGTFVAKAGVFGTGNGELRNPRAVAVSPSGRLYVADTDNNRIQYFTSQAGSPPGPGPGPNPDPDPDPDPNPDPTPGSTDTSPPSARVSAPRYSTDVARGRTFRVNWVAIPPLPSGGVGSYDVGRRVGGRRTWDRMWWETSATGQLLTGRAGTTHYFAARANDITGGNGGWSSNAYTIVPFDQRWTLRYTGKRWQTVMSRACYLGSVKRCPVRGSTASFRFRQAMSIALIIAQAKKGGRAAIYINGKRTRTVNFYSPRRRYRVPVSVKRFARPTAGIMRIVVMRSRAPRSRGYYVLIDGIAVRHW